MVFVPLINKMRDNIVAMGLPQQKLYNAVKRFNTTGSRGEYTLRIPAYHVLRSQAGMVINRAHPKRVSRLVSQTFVELTLPLAATAAT